MPRTLNDAYLVAAVRTPVGKAPRGAFRTMRPDSLLAHALRSVLARAPSLDPAAIDDVIVGCAMPEYEQGMNVARIGVLLAGLPNTVAGMTVNRFCSSGLNAVSIAADRIRTGEADLMIAAGVESMSMIPMLGRLSLNAEVFARDENVGIAYGMGLTAEKVAERWKVSRDDQDAFALESHRRALAAQAAGEFDDEIAPVAVQEHVPDTSASRVVTRERTVSRDEGPRADTTAEGLAKLRPVFAAKGSVTAGNSSQMSDGAGAVIVASEAAIRAHGLTPLARFAGFAVSGVAPEIMGVGPIAAIPKLLKTTGVRQQDLDWIELNEAFAAQSLAVVRDLGLDPAKVNPLGGAIALGHPLGATGAIRTATILHGLKRRGGRYGMVTMCVGTGMGAAGYGRNGVNREDEAMRAMTMWVAAVALAWSAAASAVEVGGIRLDEKANVGGQELVLNGAGLRTRVFIKVYVASLWLPAKAGALSGVLAKGPRRVQMNLLRDLSADQLVNALVDGLKDNNSEAELAAIKAQVDQMVATMKAFNEVKEKDVVALDFVDGATKIMLNGQAKASIPGDAFNAALMKVWLGDKPVQADLKKAMLGG